LIKKTEMNAPLLATIPALHAGQRHSRVELERRYEAMPGVKAELLDEWSS
jgi:hypothetical protein